MQSALGEIPARQAAFALDNLLGLLPQVSFDMQCTLGSVEVAELQCTLHEWALYSVK